MSELHVLLPMLKLSHVHPFVNRILYNRGRVMMGLLILIVSSCVDHHTVSHKRYDERSLSDIRLLHNDLAIASYYCGSTDQHHYIAIDRKLIWRFHSYVKVKRSELTIDEGKIFPFSSDRRMWVEAPSFFTGTP